MAPAKCTRNLLWKMSSKIGFSIAPNLGGQAHFVVVKGPQKAKQSGPVMVRLSITALDLIGALLTP